MNVIWIVADTFRRDQLGAYGNPSIKTPVLDALAARGTRFDNHYACGFPTMPTRADHHTGQWTMSYMGWEPLPDDATTLAQILGDQGVHTAAVIDTPFYTRGGMNYDRGFQTYYTVLGQEGSVTRVTTSLSLRFLAPLFRSLCSTLGRSVSFLGPVSNLQRLLVPALA